MKKTLIFIASAVIALSSCEKGFETEYSSALSGTQAAGMVEEDPDFLLSYVNGMYSYMVQYNTVGASSNQHDDYGFLSMLQDMELMGQDVALCGTMNWGSYDYELDYGQDIYIKARKHWGFYFTLIAKANEIIDFFGDEDPANPTLKGYLGQAYAIRALAYTYLIMDYQDPVEGSTPEMTLKLDALSVPLVYATRDGHTAEEQNAVSGRNSIKTVMDEVEFNLDKALPLLDGYKRSSKIEIDYTVAQGIAARYYLYTMQWAKAKAAAIAAQTGYDLMDAARLKSGFMEIEDNEVMWGFNHSTETMTSYASFFSMLGNESSGYGGVGQSVHCIDARLYNAIPETDLRKSLFNTAEGDPKAATTGAKIAYASRKFGHMDQWLQDYLYMRNAEMILIAAEADARLGNTSEAATTLSTLMAKRDPSWKATKVNVDEILLQRRIELWGEGFHYYDLKRNGLGMTRKYEGSNHPASYQLDVPAHHYRWNYQVPLSEIQNNPMISEADQTPWGDDEEEEE